MRSGGGAAIGFFSACLLIGCFPLPPPDPGWPPAPPVVPPPPALEPPTVAPPATAANAAGVPVAARTAGGATAIDGNGNHGTTKATAGAPASEPALQWDAGARLLRCGDGVALPIPADLAVYVRKNGGDDITIVPPGSPPDAAMVVTDLGTVSIPDDDDLTLDRATAVFSERLDRVAKGLMTVQGMQPTATAKDPVEPRVHIYNNPSGITDAACVLDGAPDTVWRLLLFQTGTCLFASIERVRADAAQRFAPMLQRMCLAAHTSSETRCQPRPSFSIPALWR